MSNNYSIIKANLVCRFIGHHLEEIVDMGNPKKTYCCTICKKKMTTDKYGKLIPLKEPYVFEDQISDTTTTRQS